MNATDGNYFLDLKLLENLKLSFHVQAQLKSTLQDPEPEQLENVDPTECAEYKAITRALSYNKTPIILQNIKSYLTYDYCEVIEYLQKNPAVLGIDKTSGKEDDGSPTKSERNNRFGKMLSPTNATTAPSKARDIIKKQPLENIYDIQDIDVLKEEIARLNSQKFLLRQEMKVTQAFLRDKQSHSYLKYQYLLAKLKYGKSLLKSKKRNTSAAALAGDYLSKCYHHRDEVTIQVDQMFYQFEDHIQRIKSLQKTLHQDLLTYVDSLQSSKGNGQSVAYAGQALVEQKFADESVDRLDKQLQDLQKSISLVYKHHLTNYATSSCVASNYNNSNNNSIPSPSPVGIRIAANHTIISPIAINTTTPITPITLSASDEEQQQKHIATTHHQIDTFHRYVGDKMAHWLALSEAHAQRRAASRATLLATTAADTQGNRQMLLRERVCTAEKILDEDEARLLRVSQGQEHWRNAMEGYGEERLTQLTTQFQNSHEHFLQHFQTRLKDKFSSD